MDNIDESPHREPSPEEEGDNKDGDEDELRAKPRWHTGTTGMSCSPCAADDYGYRTDNKKLRK